MSSVFLRVGPGRIDLADKEGALDSRAATLVADMNRYCLKDSVQFDAAMA